MKQAFILLISIAVVFVAPGAQGTAHLSFSDISANVTRTGCGSTKLCVETPEDCDPATDNPCLFASVNCEAGVAANNTTLSYELSGTTSGDSYIALILTANASEGNSTVFICARTNTSVNPTFFFRTMLRDNTNEMLTPTETIVTGIQNSITNTTIQCAFDVPGVNADTTFIIRLGTGSVNGTAIGDLIINVTTDALNVKDPASNLNNNNNTTNNNNTNNNNTNNNNTTITASPLNITRIGCGSSKLCIETPEDCDPQTDGPCLFTSLVASTPVALDGFTVNFELSGTTPGDSYVGVALATNASEGTSMLYVCGRNGTTNGTNGTFFFLALQRNNNDESLTVMNGRATGIQNLTSDTRIQCVFAVPGVSAAMPRNANSTFSVLLGTGSVNGSDLGSFMVNLTTPPLNIANPASNVDATTAAPTAAPSSALVTRTGCGSTKLCIETPEDCDPATNDTCLFTSVDGTAGVAPNGTTLNFELSGTTPGDSYVGVALTANASEGTAMLYVCGRNGTTNGTNGMFFFLTVQRNNNNGSLTVMNGMATGIRNLTSDTRIQCVFDVPGVNASRSRAMDTTFVVLLGTGSVNGSTLGPFNPNVTTDPLNLLDPTSNLNNNATTAAPTTTPMSGANRDLLPQALPLLLSIFILSILKTA